MDGKSMLIGSVLAVVAMVGMGNGSVPNNKYEAIEASGHVYVIDTSTGMMKKVIDGKTGSEQLDKVFTQMWKDPR